MNRIELNCFYQPNFHIFKFIILYKPIDNFGFATFRNLKNYVIKKANSNNANES